MSTRRPAARRKGSAAKRKSAQSSYIAVGIAIVLAFGALIWYGMAGRNLPPALRGLVEEYPSEGTAHVAVTQTVDYRTDPPNSGPHYANWAPPGFYDQPIADEILVHNLEHGHVIIFYDPARLTAEAEEHFLSYTRSYTGQWDAVLAVPRPGMSHPYVLAAWRHLMRLDTLNREAIAAFVDRYRGRGPENPVR